MRHVAFILLIIAVATAIGMTFLTSLQQQRLRDRMRQLEQAMAGQREALNAANEERREADRGFMLLLRARETDWVGMEGAPVEARLTAEADEVNKGSAVRLLAEVRNGSDREQTVSRPFFYDFSIRVFHDGKVLKYPGPFKSMAPPMPVVLPPGRIVRASLVLSPKTYAELGQAGVFSAEWAYSSAGSGTARTAVTWAGVLPVMKVSWRAR